MPWRFLRDASVPVEVVAEEAGWVKRAFEWRLQGVGATEIAERFNAAGLRPHSKQGNPVFTPSAIESILDSDFYCGRIRHGGEVRPGRHAAVIDEDLWLSVQARRGSGRKSVRSRSPRMLSGLAVCAECGGPLWLSWSGPSEYPHLKRQYYRETSKIRQRPCANRGSGWDAESAEAQVSAVIEGMALDSEWCARVDRAARRQPSKDVYAAERSNLEQERKRATRAYIAGALGEEEWRRVTEAIDERLVSLPAALSGGVLFGLERLRSVGQVWAGMTVEERREGARLLFERVELDTRGRRLWVKPWAEVEGVFRDRREWIVSSAPPAGAERHRPTNPRPWLFMPHELVVA